MKKRLNIEQIAARTGLSISTVSRVLAGKANTSLKARTSVLACARELGVLEGIASGRLLLNQVTLFAPQRAFDERADVFYYRVLQSVVGALRNHDVRVSLCPIEEQGGDAAKFLENINDSHSQGAILIGIDDPHIHDLAVDIGKPCVLVNCRDWKMRLPMISPDHRSIGEYAARYLLEMGHRRVMNLFCLRRYTMEYQLAGIREAWCEAGLPFTADDNLLTTASFSAKESEAVVAAWWEKLVPQARPTALLVGGDFLARGAIEALTRFGVNVPGDISVMSIDAQNLLAINNVRLSAIHVPRDELGHEAVYLLQQRLLRPQAPVPALLLAGSLATGESVRRLRGDGRTLGDAPSLYD